MDEGPWQMFVLNPKGMTRVDGDRKLENVGVASRLSLHATEAEAKAAAEDMLRKLKKVTDTEWAACYVHPYRQRDPGGQNLNPQIGCIHSSEVAGEP